MKIDHKILSIPPYISTSWKNVIALKTEEKGNLLELSIILQDGSSISIPNMEYSLIEAIFSFHAKHLENEAVPLELEPPLLPLLIDLKFLSKFDSLCRHDPENKNAPNLPEAMLEQFTLMTQSIPFENIDNIPQPEPLCNCPYCQITKAVRKATSERSVPDVSFEEEVSNKDLAFTSWIIEPLEDRGFKVIHPDELEKAHLVSLKIPLACSCGSNRCEHILAVLNS